MDPRLLISCFQQFDQTNPKFLYPLGTPNPRYVQGNMVYRIVMSNISNEDYVFADASLVGSVNGKNATTWQIADGAIPSGGALVFQGLSPDIRGGLCVVSMADVPKVGPVALRNCWKVGADIQAECTMPLSRNDTDIYADGPEHPGPMETEGGETETLATLVEKRDGLVSSIAGAQEAIKILNPLIAKLGGAVVAFVLLAALLFASTGGAAPVVAVVPPAGPLYQSGQLSVETFVGESTADFKKFDGLYGVGMSYSYHRNWLIGGRILHNGWDTAHGTVIQDVQARLQGRLLSGDACRLSPYVALGVGYRIGSAGSPKGRESIHLDSAIGLEYRFTAHFGIFSEAGWQANLAGRNGYVGSAGARWTF